MSDLLWDLRWSLGDALKAGLKDDDLAFARKQLEKLASELQDRIEDSLREDLADNLAALVYHCTERAIEELLAGDEEQFKRYLNADPGGYTGRGREYLVMHGQLYEARCMEIRRKLVDAYPEILKDERIKDLEDQVGSLVKQVTKLQAENERLRASDREVCN